MSTYERQKYKIAGPATWELIRAAYLAGESAPALAERFGVSEAAIRKRITVERWSKRDYAAALEARGLPPPPKRELLNIAERFAATYTPPPPPAIEASDPVAAAAALEQRALAQVGEALARGKASDAKALAAIADQMRKRLETANATREVEEEAAQRSQAEAEEAICDIFVKAAYIANAMVHAPSEAPAAFQGLIKLWREQNLGEGEADADRVAAKIAKAQAAWLDGSFEETLPDCVRERMDEAWAQQRERLAQEPTIPRFWTASEDEFSATPGSITTSPE
jgi:hypothetical protein